MMLTILTFLQFFRIIKNSFAQTLSRFHFYIFGGNLVKHISEKGEKLCIDRKVKLDNISLKDYIYTNMERTVLLKYLKI